jgi:hypothetical protein
VTTKNRISRRDLIKTGAAGAALDGMIEELLPLDERWAKVNDVSMKSTAAPVVSLLIKVLPPLAPNTV